MAQAAAAPQGPGRPSRSVAGIWLRHDIRRPASWAAVALAAAAFAFVSVGLKVSLTSVAVMTAAAVVAIGELPAAFLVWDASFALQPGGRYRFRRQPLALPAAGSWLACRLVWPLLGLGGAAASAVLQGSPSGVILIGVVAGTVATGLTALTTGGLRLAGLSAADAATASLLAGWLAAAGMALTGGLFPASGEWPLLLVGFGCWLVVAGGLLGLAQWLHLSGGGGIAGMLPRQLSFAAASGARRPDQLAAIGLLGVLPARSAWRRVLRTAAMLLALGAMIGWLLLDPASAGRYGFLAAAVFGAFGVPAAALLDGWEVVRGWRILSGSTSAPGAAAPFFLALPSPSLQAAVVLAGHGVLMLWPPLVVAVVAVGNPAALPALLVAAGFAAGAALAGGGCVVAHAVGGRGETALAAGLGLLACWVWLWQAVAAGFLA